MNTTKMSNEVQKEKRWIGRMKLRRKGGRWRRSGECVKQVRVPHRESEEKKVITKERWTAFDAA